MINLLNMNDVSMEWRNFISIVKNNPTVRPITLEAWKRCTELGLKPNSIKFKFLSDKELKQKLQKNSKLVETSAAYMDSLSLSLTGIPHIVALSDSEGWIIDSRGTPEELGGRTVGICLGASWAERNIGNNGIGTALATGQPALVYGIEHFGMVYGSCACIGVPIRHNDEIIGAIDISVPVQYAHPARLHIAVACVTSIEATMSNLNNYSQSVSSDTKLSATSELIATAVHDLKNPLAIIRGLGQLGNLTTDKHLAQNYFDRIIKQVDEMNSMVTELLSIFKPEELIPQKVIPIIKEVLESFKPICNSRNISLYLVNNVDIYINMCERLFKRAIENLINNAVQIMGDNGMIQVMTQIDKDSIIISISDNAGGIPEELRETLFEPFSFKRSGGTGLGLFMAYHTITNTHKGQIWFETETGHGTTFFIRLPITQNGESNTMRQYQLI
ncbi:ATP-binding protein [Clostridium sp. CX1]|uniref:ATP-binding protein n=1 Tax=Clostridium sp. CX1 TaxID=2978346 RepID=UPI0021C024E4|nr:ATP-binding protein [Clostridium sp. CX1]MCT8978092.1 ATP-binding protein [Clostridium sp. CX1]